MFDLLSNISINDPFALGLGLGVISWFYKFVFDVLMTLINIFSDTK